MRNKKNDANGFYLCISDLVVDGVLMCTAGKRYRIQDAESGPGEAPAEVAGYCDIFGCANVYGNMAGCRRTLPDR